MVFLFACKILLMTGILNDTKIYNTAEIKALNPKMHNMGQIDPNDASHVDCLKHFGNLVSAFLDFVSNLLHYCMR